MNYRVLQAIVDFGVHHSERILIARIMVTLFVDMLVLVRHFIAIQGTQGEGSKNATMPDIFKAFCDFGGAKMARNGLKLDSFHLLRHPKWSGITFGKTHF